jgi:phospholipid/cholesterol/gamma-HCH transport system permease protein
LKFVGLQGILTAVTLFIPLQNALEVLGEFFVFVGYTLRSFKKLWKRRGLFLRHCEFIGVTSTGIITVAALFMGAVLGYQLYVSFKYFGAEALLGGSVGVALFRELAPVMGAIMVTGRAGSAIAAEIASMQITEQVDALEVMAIDPIEYLVAPRVAAGVLMMPLLAIYFAVVASLAAAGISCGVMGLDSAIFWTQFAKVVDKIDIIHCVVKGALFGLSLTWLGCFCGYRAEGGARAVGLATRNTVVASCLVILLCDYVLTSLLPFGYPTLRAG